MSFAEMQQTAESITQRTCSNFNSSRSSPWTASIYDTAWTSMVRDPSGDWLFPESFQYILDSQHPGSGWPSSASAVDSILNTASSIITILRHMACPKAHSIHPSSELSKRVLDAQNFLQKTLDIWDVGASNHVGFEILVPAMLRMLKQYDISLDFPGRLILENLHSEKMKRFDPKFLYGRRQSTPLHSLEAFVELIDISKVAHHLFNGSMMGSPSATAAYLMHNPEWDENAAHYLRSVMGNTSDTHPGAIPVTYPSEIFEFTWIMSTFLHCGIDLGTATSSNYGDSIRTLEEIFAQQSEGVGFSRGMLSDADDTAKTILVLNLSKRPTMARVLVDRFLSNKGHIMTYPGERNASISANCNAMLAMLQAPDTEYCFEAIKSVALDLCLTWESGRVSDKWNLSARYPMMLLAQALTALLTSANLEKLPRLPEDLLRYHVPLVLTQILNRILFSHKVSARTEPQQCPEIVAYETLSLKTLSQLPWVQHIRDRVDKEIKSRIVYLTNSAAKWSQPSPIWIAKLSYGFGLLSETYCAAAILFDMPTIQWQAQLLVSIPQELCHKHISLAHFYQKIGRSEEPIWKYMASLIESNIFFHRLQESRDEIFPKREGFEDKYLFYVSAAWITTNNLFEIHYPASILWSMIHFSMLDYLVDEFVESAISQLDGGSWKSLRQFIHAQFESYGLGDSLDFERNLERTETCARENQYSPTAVRTERDILKSYMLWVVQHESVTRASKFDQRQVRSELVIFLEAHLVQLEQNLGFRCDKSDPNNQSGKPDYEAISSFHSWSNTTAAHHTSCALSFAFLTCLISNHMEQSGGVDCFRTVEEKFKAADLQVNLAVMSRLYNDYGSVSRDAREGNLNSINFPEFAPKLNVGSFESSDVRLESSNGTAGHRLESLLRLAEYKRDCALSIMENLFFEFDKRGDNTPGSDFVKRGILIFVHVAGLFADMYVARDLTNSVNKT